jgi:ATP/maltotriose-dependent transcriptional regulator MalT
MAELYSNQARLANIAGNYPEARQLAQKAIPMFKEVEVAYGVSLAHKYLAWAAVELGDYTQARHSIYEAITLEKKLHLINFTPYSLEIAALLRLAEGDIDAALELVGLIEKQITHLNLKHLYTLERLEKLKAEVPEEQYLAAVRRGEAHDFGETVQQLLEDLQGQLEAEQQPVSQPLADRLTQRELEVLQLVADGLSNRQIARQLVLSLGTVKWYVSDIYSKLDVSRRTQAVVRARELNLIT